MRRLTSGAAGLALGLLAVAPARAEAPPACEGKDLTDPAGLAEAAAKRADDLVNAGGLLWRIDRAGLAPSYLYGTIHSTDAAALAMAGRAAERIEGAKVVATELGSLDAVERPMPARRRSPRRSIAITTRSRACLQRTARTS
jgi:uncharacterized protein YbaP (TraB family)